MIQRLRIEQMKKLRKEIRKLEKLEKFRLEKAMNKDSPILNQDVDEILEKIAAKSEDSSVTTISSSEKPLSLSKAAITSALLPSAASTKKGGVARNVISNYRGIEGKSASGSDNNKQSTKDLSSNKVNKKRKPSVASVKEFGTTAKKSEDNPLLSQKTK